MDGFLRIQHTPTILDRDECFKFWGQKFIVQVHGGITFAGNTSQLEACNTHDSIVVLVSSFMMIVDMESDLCVNVTEVPQIKAE